MLPRIVHIYGPLWINGYGLFLAIGLTAFTMLLYSDNSIKKMVSRKTLSNSLSIGIFAGIIGARIAAVVEHPEIFAKSPLKFFAPWEGGLGVVGALIGVLVAIPFYLWVQKAPVIPVLDIAAVYAPIIQVFARIGCFSAGCCYGKVVTNSKLPSVVFTNPDGLAPLGLPLHPTQLYISAASAIIFTIMLVARKITKKNGQLSSLFLMLESVSRFSIDFLRGDREMVSETLSIFQIASAAIFLLAAISFIYFTAFGENRSE
jgi:phosphatidylglycerol:prolipoprotein diacylglycerol transferase